MHQRPRFYLFAVSLLSVATAGLIVCVSVKFPTPWRIFPESRPCACGKCLRDGESCLKELVDEAPEPFLSRTLRPPHDAFNWWKRLQASKCNYTSYNETLDRVFQVFKPFPDVAPPGPHRCKTCAVVGNSRNLMGSHYGSLIDSHDIVIRMNRGLVKSYEDDVGSRTTHHILYPESAINLENTTHLVFFPFKTRDFEWLLKMFDSKTQKTKMIANKDLVMIVNPAFMKYVHEEWLARKGHWASTGFMTFVLSLYMCDQVNVFGFGADGDGNWSHYFEKLRNKRLKTGLHPGKHEYDIFQKLHNKKKIELFKGH